MFHTDKPTEIHIPYALQDGLHEQQWPYVRLYGYIPWLLVVTERKCDDEYSLPSTLFLANMEQLQELAGSETVEIIEVNLVTPNHMNRLGHWAMAPLAALWEGTHPTEDYPVQVYVTELGTRYCLDGSIRDESELRDKYLIYGTSK